MNKATLHDLFNPKLLDETLLDEELVLNFENAYRVVKKYCEKHDIEWDTNFVKFGDRLHKMWAGLNQEDTGKLKERYINGMKYMRLNNNDLNAQMLLAGITTRLKNRGFNVYTIPTADLYTEVEISDCRRLHESRKWLETNENDAQYEEKLTEYTNLADRLNEMGIKEDQAWSIGQKTSIENVFGDLVEATSEEVKLL